MKRTVTKATRQALLEALGSINQIVHDMLCGDIKPDDTFLKLAKRDIKKIHENLGYLIEPNE